MLRALKPSARPLITLTLVSSPMLVIAIVVLFKRAFDFESLEMFGAVSIFYIFLIIIIRGMRITVSDNKITFRQCFVFFKSVSFAKIEHSHVQYLAEANHPISLSIYKTAKGNPALTIPLKSFTEGDVQWLIENKALKISVYPGFTKRKREPPSKKPEPFIFHHSILEFVEEISSPSGLWRAVIAKDSCGVYRYLLYHWDLSDYEYIAKGFWNCYDSASFFDSSETARKNALEDLKAKSGEQYET